MTAKEVAVMLGIDVRTVRKYYRDLNGIRIGKIYVFSKDLLFSSEDEADSSNGLLSSEIVGDDRHDLLA